MGKAFCEREGCGGEYKLTRIEPRPRPTETEFWPGMGGKVEPKPPEEARDAWICAKCGEERPDSEKFSKVLSRLVKPKSYGEYRGIPFITVDDYARMRETFLDTSNPFRAEYMGEWPPQFPRMGIDFGTSAPAPVVSPPPVTAESLEDIASRFEGRVDDERTRAELAHALENYAHFPMYTPPPLRFEVHEDVTQEMARHMRGVDLDRRIRERLARRLAEEIVNAVPVDMEENPRYLTRRYSMRVSLNLPPPNSGRMTPTRREDR